jgi:hypothetical protein
MVFHASTGAELPKRAAQGEGPWFLVLRRSWYSLRREAHRGGGNAVSPEARRPNSPPLGRSILR